MSGRTFTILLIALLTVQRLLELRLARRNEAWARGKGATEYGREHYPLFIVLHSTWLLSLLVEGWVRDTSVNWLFFGALVLLQVARYRVIATLGPYWNTRILIVPGGTRVRRGLYRWLRHPNYVVVALEIALAPLCVGAWGTATVFTLLNAALLLGIRIPAEERALREYRSAAPR